MRALVTGGTGFIGRIDSRRIRAELGWEPRVRYDEAIARMAASLATA